MASQAEPSFLEGMASRAEPSFFSQKLEPKPSLAEPSFGSDPTLLPTYPNIGHHLWMSPNDYNILDQFSIKLEIKQRILNRLNFLILTYFQVGK